mmetsp:Transcript_12241/g.28367  ORF Transcript_12241/g.28367 Transcript_12241/m.28367 type:complete len:284 (+) Transcript_12241:2117-2968(+)
MLLLKFWCHYEGTFSCGYAVASHVILDSFNLHFLSVKHSRCQSSLDSGFLEHIREVGFFSCSTACDHGNGNGLRDGFHERKIKPFALSIHVNAIEHYFSCTKCFSTLCDCDCTNITGFSAPFDGTLKPAKAFSIGTQRRIVIELHHHVFWINLVSGADIDTLRVNGNNDRLDPIHPRDGLNGCLSGGDTSAGNQSFGRLDCITPNANFVSPGSKVSGCHLQCRISLTIRCGVTANAASDSERHKNVARSLFQDLEHRHILQDPLPKTRDVEKGNLIRSFSIIA